MLWCGSQLLFTNYFRPANRPLKPYLTKIRPTCRKRSMSRTPTDNLLTAETPVRINPTSAFLYLETYKFFVQSKYNALTRIKNSINSFDKQHKTMYVSEEHLFIYDNNRKSTMLIGIPKETHPLENRVATFGVIEKLKKKSLIFV